jgi:hypothetical protein
MNINKKYYVYAYVSSSGRDHDMKIYRPGNWVDREEGKEVTFLPD